MVDRLVSLLGAVVVLAVLRDLAGPLAMVVVVTAWVAVPVQASLGFVPLTAVVTWVLQVYPALTRRPALALRLPVLRRVDAVRTLAEEDVPMAATLPEAVLDAYAADHGFGLPGPQRA